MSRYIAQKLWRRLDLPGVPAIEFVWSGTIALTPDFLPRIFRAAPGIYAGIGCNGRGIAFSTALGQVLADIAADSGPDAGRDAVLPLQDLAPLTAHWLTRRAPAVVIPWRRLRDRRAVRRQS